MYVAQDTELSPHSANAGKRFEKKQQQQGDPFFLYTTHDHAPQSRCNHFEPCDRILYGIREPSNMSDGHLQPRKRELGIGARDVGMPKKVRPMEKFTEIILTRMTNIEFG